MRKHWFVTFVIFLSILFHPLEGRATLQSPKRLSTPHSGKTVRIIVYQNYYDGVAKKLYLPFEKIARRLLGYAGVTVVSPGAKQYDYSLEISAIGTPRGAAYEISGGDTRYLYTGADLDGEIIFKSDTIT